MVNKNTVFIATSIDGYIADKDGGIEWLDTIPEINTIDTGYHDMMADIDALVMGRATFDKVCEFDIDWPYKKPVYVVSRTLKVVPKEYDGKVFLLRGTLTEILEYIHNEGYQRLYIDGGKLIQSFLSEDLIDEMVITIIPILLGDGFPLFGYLGKSINFECQKSTLFLNKIVQNHYIRIRQS